MYRYETDKEALEKINVGDEFISSSRTISESDVMLFGGLTGDLNELHVSSAFAEKSKYGQRIAHGMLTISMANGLFYRFELFRTSVFLGIENLKLLKPVFIGDTLTLKMTIAEKRLTKDGKRYVLGMKYNLVNQHGDLVLDAMFRRMVTDEE